MNDNELTAGERYTIEMLSGRLAGAGCIAKLLRLYDAALAQADLMDRLATGHQKEKRETQNRLVDALARAEAAEEDRGTIENARVAAWSVARGFESRLAEATALLDDIDDHEQTPSWYRRREALLSATSAQAAEPEMIDSGEPVERQYWKLRRAQEKTEHPDTIALRECRAELERTETTLRQDYNRAAEQCLSLRAERDTALGNYNDALDAYVALVAERNTALARIVELESRHVSTPAAVELRGMTRALELRDREVTSMSARIAELEAQNAQLVQCCKECQLDVLETRIARAVELLENVNRYERADDLAQTVLEALK